MRFHMKVYLICIFLTLLFLLSFIVELYFSEFIIIKFICLYIGVLLTLDIFIDYLRTRTKQKLDVSDKKIDYENWTQSKQNAKKVGSYYIKRNLINK